MHEEICGNCNGSGEGMYGGSICIVCKGDGALLVEDDIDCEEYTEEQ